MSQTFESLDSVIVSLRSATSAVDRTFNAGRQAEAAVTRATNAIEGATDVSAAVSDTTVTIESATQTINGMTGTVAQVGSSITSATGALSQFAGVIGSSGLTSAVNDAMRSVSMANAIARNIGGAVNQASRVVSFISGLPDAVSSAFDAAVGLFTSEEEKLATAVEGVRADGILYSSELTDLEGQIPVTNIPTIKDWTILDENAIDIITFTSVFDVEIIQNGTASIYPLELGSFASYNKTTDPIDIRATLGVQGIESDFNAAIHLLEIYQREAQTLNVITPSRAYGNMTLESFTYRRSVERGAGMLVVELRLSEIKQVLSLVTTRSTWRPRNDTSAPTEERGQVEPEKTVLADGIDAARSLF